MKCKHCGNEIDQNSRFCGTCGTPMDILSIEENREPLKWFKQKKWIIPAVAACILLLIVALILPKPPEAIDFADYLITEVNGYEYCGEINVSINVEKLTKDLLGESPNKSKTKKYERYIENEQRLSSALWVYTQIDSPLQNGDVFLANILILDESIFEELGYKIEGVEKTIRIQIGKDTKKFKELVDVDILERLAMEFTGTNGDGEAEIVSEPIIIDVISDDGGEYTLTFCYISTPWGDGGFEIYSSREEDNFAMITVSIENDSNLSNGDKVKVILKHNAVSLAENIKVNINTKEKEFTVTGLE